MVFQDSEVAKIINRQFIAIKSVSRQGEDVELRQKYEIPGNPTVMLLNSDGVEIDRLVGFDGDRDAYMKKLIDFSAGINTLARIEAQYAADTTSVAAAFALAEKYWERYERVKAAEYYQQVLTGDPENKFRHQEKSLFAVAYQAALTEQNIEPMLSFLKETTTADYLKQAYMMTTRHFERQGQPDKVLDYYQEAFERFEPSTGMLNACAWFIFQNEISEKYTWGIELAKNATAIAPDDAGIWDTLGWLYFVNGEFENAIDAETKASDLDTAVVEFRDALAKFKAAQS